MYKKTSDYPECSSCTARATDKCPALYRVSESCPHNEKIVQSNINFFNFTLLESGDDMYD